MKNITLTQAETIVLYDILLNLNGMFAGTVGSIVTTSLNDSERAPILAEAASEFNYDEVEVVDTIGSYNMYSMINHFLERIETVQYE